jgi:predicted regulator of Ras-like GTPase activity (Roadblock/LC7/MglB family)
MIICSNCGAINSDETSRFCRKCGALLPLTSKPSRIRIPKIDSKDQVNEIPITLPKNNDNLNNIENDKKAETHQLSGEWEFFTTKSKSPQEQNHLQLQEIPKPKTKQKLSSVAINPPKIIRTEDVKNLDEIPFERSEETTNEKKEFLKEIAPKPFDGSIMASKRAYNPPIAKTAPTVSDPPKTKNLKLEDSSLKQKHLEEDMLDVLAVLSKKLKIPKKEAPKESASLVEDTDEKIIPTSMNQILGEILNLDQFIEASAIVKADGTILASALSNRISDSLFLTIGQNLSMIGNDIIEGLSAGKLNSISIRGTEGILDLAPIDKKYPELADIILMIFSHPRVKPGIIAFAVSIVKKQIKEYLGIK